MKTPNYPYHVCDRCYSLFKEERLAQYRVKGILVKHAYYCLDHIIANMDDNPNLLYEFSDTGFSDE